MGRLPADQSARAVMAGWQKAALTMAVLAAAYVATVDPKSTATVVVAIVTWVYVLASAYKLLVVARAFWQRPEVVVSPEETSALADLPLYTVLLPLYREAGVLTQLIENVCRLDYPPEKLDVKLLVEPDDPETLLALDRVRLPAHFEVLVVPPGAPKGKPRACNYGLAQARGQFLVIYDAEDRPEPDQLRKAIVAFRKSGSRVACVQAKLSYYNASQNLLTRWFTCEYAAWFDLALAGLHAWGAPIPLGGTSNHFRTDVLRGLRGWDPYNVTEDADLGVRLHRQGWRTVIVDSVTYEEATAHLGNWLRQRTRWIKGYMQTWLVHMRHPFRLLSQLGVHGFASFQVMIGLAVLSYLLNPLFWCLLGLWYASRPTALAELFPAPVLYGGSAAFVLGNLSFIYSHVMGCLRRRYYSLVKYCWGMPFYWLLMSVAAWRALFQLPRRPHYWEKTEHGLFQEGTATVAQQTVGRGR
ncbi:MAG TPA: glycosyltransferase [Dehalococcoidia bacterium]|nr:glycosyltransferase [Dehalococcoidia bacterium]